MSRAINIDAPKDHVVATCTRRKLGISAIESLPSGGTRVVTNNADETAILAKAYGKKVIVGIAPRTPTRLMRG